MKPEDYSKLIAGADQAGAMLRDTIPPLLRTFHDSLVAQGFTDEQAFQLTLKYLEITFPARPRLF